MKYCIIEKVNNVIATEMCVDLLSNREKIEIFLVHYKNIRPNCVVHYLNVKMN